jgi:hypothetical protein
LRTPAAEAVVVTNSTAQPGPACAASRNILWLASPATVTAITRRTSAAANSSRRQSGAVHPE